MLWGQNNLGRLKTTTASGDTDGDGDHDIIYSYGTRSFSIRDLDLELVYDSGNQLTKNILADLADRPDADAAMSVLKERSDDKGVEPEAIAIGKLGKKTYAFVGLERIGGIAVYEISKPAAPTFVTYVNTRNFAANEESPEAGDIGPECVLFIPAADSPNGEPLVVVAHEVSGTITVFAVKGS